jgi:molecular chaperone DnaJ
MDFYIVLGLRREASADEIKRAYRRLARRYHPDINPGDERAAAQFDQIVQAFETLSDPTRRARYDAGTPTDAPPDPHSVGFEGFDFSVSITGAEAPTFGDLFSEVIQHRLGQVGSGLATRGVDLHQVLMVPFAMSVKGGERAITVTREEPCRRCAGSGRAAAPARPCARCRGAGASRVARGHMVFSRPCTACGGTGRQPAPPCPACARSQRQLRADTITVHVPPGVADGARLVVPGLGHAGRAGGDSGDLHVTVRVEPDPMFTREGDDLHLVLPVAVHEAALGARIAVPSFDEPVRLRVPPGTQSGQRFRLRERGVPSVRDGRRGDLVIEVRLVLPPVLDERSKDLLREFGRLHPEDVREQLGASVSPVVADVASTEPRP